MKFACVELLCFFVILNICKAEERNGMFRAAVHEIVQYNKNNASDEELINKNLEKYSVAAQLANSNDVDIIVFPEKGLFPVKLDPIWFLNKAEDVPDSTEEANPCNDVDGKFKNSPILRNLSCIAQKHKLFVVATLIDKKKCEVHERCENEKNKNSCVSSSLKCPLLGYFYFNTLVVFDRQGLLVARYYKRHPFTVTDAGITMPKYPQPTYFQTDFGVSSTFIGFDILFNDTFKDLETNPSTTFVSYTNWWFDHTPMYYFGVPIQQTWSLVHKVPILSSNVHSPNSGSLGSGIYLPGEGAVIYSYNPDGKTKLLISNVPTSFSGGRINKESLNTKFLYIDDDNSVSELKGEEPRVFKKECGENVLGMNPTTPLSTKQSLTDYRCKQTLVQQYTFVKLNKTEDNVTACSNNFCCSLEYKADSMDETFYFAVSGNPLNFYAIYKFGVQSCFLSRCEPVAGQPCRNFLLKSNTKFQRITMKGNFTTKYIHPHLVDSDLRLTDVGEWYFDGKSQLTYNNKKGKNLLHADMYGRIYEEDSLINVGKVINWAIGIPLLIL